MALPGRNLAYWDSTKATWVVENDSIQIQVGASSADIKLSATLPVINGGPIDMSAVGDNAPGAITYVNICAAPYDLKVLRRGSTLGLVIHMRTAEKIDLRLFDLKGGLLGRVSKQEISEGTHFIAFPDMRKARSGIYLIRGSIGRNVVTLKARLME
jgi:hypothetical protein